VVVPAWRAGGSGRSEMRGVDARNRWDLGVGIRGLGGLSVCPMASSATTKAARRGARDATIAAQGEIARRTRANMDDLTVFFSARQRVDAVDDWLAERVEALRVQPDARRADQRRQCGGAGPAECVLWQADRYRPGSSA
jgi:hypothetical protein